MPAADGGGAMFAMNPEHLDAFASTLSELAGELSAQRDRLAGARGMTSFGTFGEAQGLQAAYDDMLTQVLNLTRLLHSAQSAAGHATTSAKVKYQLADAHSVHSSGKAADHLDSATVAPTVRAAGS